jgi:uncharacterized protein (DUF58 family)
MQPTLRAVALSAPGLVLAALPTLLGDGWWWLWALGVAMFAVAAAVDAALTPSRGALRWSLTLPSRLFMGREAAAVLRLEGAGRDARARAEISGHAAPTGTVRFEGAEVRLPLKPVRRGQLRVSSVWVRYTGPLGLMQRTLEVRIDQQRPVLPDVLRVRGRALMFSNRNERRAGTKVERFVGDGSEFEAMREYAPGMDIRSIDWKASARHRSLLAREFRAERNHSVVFALDTGLRMGEPLAAGEVALPRLDHAIHAALEMGWIGLKQGDRVGLFTFGARPGRFIQPRGGVRTFEGLVAAAAELAYERDETNYTLGLTTLATRLRRRSLVVVLTDFEDAIGAELMVENLGRLARRHLVIFVAMRDPWLASVREQRPVEGADVERANVADELLQEREVVLAKLKRLGVHCVDATPDRVGNQLINRYLEILRREMI